MQRNYNVLQVIDRLEVGGGERIMVSISNILEEHGIRVQAMTLVDKGKLSDFLQDKITITNLGRPYRFHLASFYKAHQVFTKFDIIHVHLKYNFVYVCLVKFIFMGTYKVVLHDHDNTNIATIPFGLKFFFRLNPNYITVTQSMMDWAKTRMKINADTCWLLPNIVIKEKTPVLKNDNDPFRMVLVSNIKPEKNIEFAIELFCLLGKKNQTMMFDIMGQITDLDYYAKLKAEIEDKQMDSRIHFITHVTNVQKELPRYQMALHTSENESGPLVLIEYLAMQIPFVAFRTGEVATQLVNYFPSFFLDHFNREGWVNRMEDIIRREGADRESMARVFNTLYSEDQYFDRLDTIYQRILKTKV